MVVNEELVRRQQARDQAKKRREADPQNGAPRQPEARDQTPEDHTPAGEGNPRLWPPKVKLLDRLDRPVMAYAKTYGPWAIVAVLTVFIGLGRIQGSPRQQDHVPQIVKKNGVYHLEEFGIVVSADGKILATPEGRVSRGWFSGRPVDDSVSRFTVEQYAAGWFFSEDTPIRGDFNRAIKILDRSGSLVRSWSPEVSRVQLCPCPLLKKSPSLFFSSQSTQLEPS
jgi:hypothetical protein